MKLHERLRTIRKQRGMTLVQVAAAAHVASSFLSNLERGKANPTLPTLARIAATYHMSLAELLAGITNEEFMAEDSSPSELAIQGEDEHMNTDFAGDVQQIHISEKISEDDDLLEQTIKIMKTVLNERMFESVIEAVLEVEEKIKKAREAKKRQETRLDGGEKPTDVEEGEAKSEDE